jgi:hypothetical protein
MTVISDVGMKKHIFVKKKKHALII